MNDDLVHLSSIPFTAICGADEKNQSTTQVIENVTCMDCIVKETSSVNGRLEGLHTRAYKLWKRLVQRSEETRKEYESDHDNGV